MFVCFWEGEKGRDFLPLFWKGQRKLNLLHLNLLFSFHYWHSLNTNSTDEISSPCCGAGTTNTTQPPSPLLWPSTRQRSARTAAPSHPGQCGATAGCRDPRSTAVPQEPPATCCPPSPPRTVPGAVLGAEGETRSPLPRQDGVAPSPPPGHG